MVPNIAISKQPTTTATGLERDNLVNITYPYLTRTRVAYPEALTTCFNDRNKGARAGAVQPNICGRFPLHYALN